GRGSDHLGERPVRHALAVRQAASDQHHRVLELLDEVECEAALADARLAVDRDQMWAAVAHGSREGVAEQGELDLSSDGGRGNRADRTAPALGRAPRAPDLHRFSRPGEPARARRLDLDGPRCEAPGAWADEDLLRPCDVLETSGGVDRGPG